VIDENDSPKPECEKAKVFCWRMRRCELAKGRPKTRATQCGRRVSCSVSAARKASTVALAQRRDFEGRPGNIVLTKLDGRGARRARERRRGGRYAALQQRCQTYRCRNEPDRRASMRDQDAAAQVQRSASLTSRWTMVLLILLTRAGSLPVGMADAIAVQMLVQTNRDESQRVGDDLVAARR